MKKGKRYRNDSNIYSDITIKKFKRNIIFVTTFACLFLALSYSKGELSFEGEYKFSIKQDDHIFFVSSLTNEQKLYMVEHDEGRMQARLVYSSEKNIIGVQASGNDLFLLTPESVIMVRLDRSSDRSPDISTEIPTNSNSESSISASNTKTDIKEFTFKRSIFPVMQKDFVYNSSFLLEENGIYSFILPCTSGYYIFKTEQDISKQDTPLYMTGEHLKVSIQVSAVQGYQDTELTYKLAKIIIPDRKVDEIFFIFDNRIEIIKGGKTHTYEFGKNLKDIFLKDISWSDKPELILIYYDERHFRKQGVSVEIYQDMNIKKKPVKVITRDRVINVDSGRFFKKTAFKKNIEEENLIFFYYGTQPRFMELLEEHNILYSNLLVKKKSGYTFDLYYRKELFESKDITKVYKIFLADLNGDKVSDMGYFYDGEMLLFFNQGNGTYPVEPEIREELRIPNNFEIHDIDVNGTDDIILFYRGNIKIIRFNP